MTIAMVQITLSFCLVVFLFSLSYRARFCHFHACRLDAFMLSDLKYPNLIFGSYLDPFQVDLNCKYQGFLSIYKD